MDGPEMAPFQWNPKRSEVALHLAKGYTIDETTQATGVPSRTIKRWKANLEFAIEVDRLSCMVDIAGRSERLRLAMRVIRRLGERTDKDLLDWVKYAQGETDGIKLDLATLIEATTSVAGGGPTGPAEPQNTGGDSVAADPE